MTFIVIDTQKGTRAETGLLTRQVIVNRLDHLTSRWIRLDPQWGGLQAHVATQPPASGHTAAAYNPVGSIAVRYMSINVSSARARPIFGPVLLTGPCRLHRDEIMSVTSDIQAVLNGDRPVCLSQVWVDIVVRMAKTLDTRATHIRDKLDGALSSR
jgi:hypothetical protein